MVRRCQLTSHGLRSSSLGPALNQQSLVFTRDMFSLRTVVLGTGPAFFRESCGGSRDGQPRSGRQRAWGPRSLGVLPGGEQPVVPAGGEAECELHHPPPPPVAPPCRPDPQSHSDGSQGDRNRQVVRWGCGVKHALLPESQHSPMMDLGCLMDSLDGDHPPAGVAGANRCMHPISHHAPNPGTPPTHPRSLLASSSQVQCDQGLRLHHP